MLMINLHRLSNFRQKLFQQTVFTRQVIFIIRQQLLWVWSWQSPTVYKAVKCTAYNKFLNAAVSHLLWCYLAGSVYSSYFKQRVVDPFHLTSSSEKSWMRHTGGQFHCAFLYTTLSCALCSEVRIWGDTALIHVNLTPHQHGERGISHRVWPACKGSIVGAGLNQPPIRYRLLLKWHMRHVSWLREAEFSNDKGESADSGKLLKWHSSTGWKN